MSGSYLLDTNIIITFPIWIAAIAQQHDLVLVSRDRHFQEVENLTVEIW